MNFKKTKLEGVIIIEPKIFGDERGYFFESFNQSEFEKNIGKINFIQDNESKSRKGVLRGLHFQNPPYAQAKLVRCIKGSVLDVAVDIRKNSKTYGQYIAVELSEYNKKQLFVPKGFAHGFVVLEEDTVFAYKVDAIYAPDFEDGIIWNDSLLKIDWKLQHNEIILSQKDKQLQGFKGFKTTFSLD